MTSTWPPRFTGPMFKASRTDRKLKEAKFKRTVDNAENAEKAKVRRRDRGCRFPKCGCRTLGLTLETRPEVSHEKHKGSGGNPSGSRSKAAMMVQLCKHRHQDGRVSRHKGTLKVKFLTRAKYDGPVAWLVDISAIAGLGGTPRWKEVARESKVGVLEPLTPWQDMILAQLATLTC